MCEYPVESDNLALSSNSRLAPLITKVLTMLKNPNIDENLGKVLEDFLQKFDHCDEHIFNLNFAEVALLLQNSADMYSKKVDILWDVILDYQKRVILSEKKTKENAKLEIEKIEERKRKYKRKRNTAPGKTETDTILKSAFFGHPDSIDYLSNQGNEQYTLEEKWKQIPRCSKSNRNEPLEPSSQLFLPDDALYSEEKDYIGRFNQFHSVSCLSSNHLAFSSNISNLNHNTAGIVVSEISIRLQPMPAEILTQLVHKKAPELSLSQHMDFKSQNCYVLLEKLPDDLLTEKLRRMSRADSMFDDDDVNGSGYDSDFSGSVSKSIRIEERNKSFSQESGIYDCDDDQSLSGVSLGKSVVTESTKRVANSKKNLNERGKVMKKTTKKSLLLREKIVKLSKGFTTVTLGDFEQFLFNHYKPADGEEVQMSEKSDDDFEDDREDFTLPPTPEPTIITKMPENETLLESSEANFDSAFISDFDASELSQRDDLNEPIEEDDAPLPPTEESSTVRELQLLEESRRNVSEWRTHIMPIIRNAKASTFDIHEYGGKILEAGEVGTTMRFKAMMAGQRGPEVARQFMAALQLANSRNIEILGTEPGRLANETLELRIVDKARHHEALEEYQAPSEYQEVFRDQFERLKDRKGGFMHSTPSVEEPPRKRAKLCVKRSIFS